MTNILRAITPEGGSGRLLSSQDHYLFRYHEEAAPLEEILAWDSTIATHDDNHPSASQLTIHD